MSESLYRLSSLFTLPLLLGLCSVAMAEDGFEENDTRETASVLTLGTTLNNLHCADDDWWRIDNVQPGLLKLEMAQINFSDINMQLYDSSGTLISQGSGISVTETIRFGIFSPGTYYVRIWTPSGNASGYTLLGTQTETFSGDDANEDNDNLANATAISPSPGQVYSGLVNKDEDWFSMTLNLGTVIFDTSYNTSATDMHISFYDSTGNRLNTTLAGGVEGANGFTLTQNITIPGTYYVSVLGDSGETYSLTANGIALVPEDGFEENDSRATASAITIGNNNTNLLCADDDWYVVNNVQAGTFRAVMSQSSGVDLNMQLYDANGTQIDGGSGQSVEEVITFSISQPGTYYIRVWTPGGQPNSYSLSTTQSLINSGDDSNEENDNLSQATAITPTGGQAITGLVNQDEDWFSFSLQTGDVTVATTYDIAAADIHISFFDANGNRLNTTLAASEGANGFTLTQNISTAGTYYAAVLGSSGQAYSLTISGVALISDDAFEENDSLAAAKPITLGATNDNLLCADDDWYSVANLQTGVLRIVMTQSSGTDLNMQLYDANGTQLDAGSGQSVDEVLSFSVNQPGTYFIRVWTPSGQPNAYTLFATQSPSFSGDDSREEDDTISSAVSIPFSPDISISGLVANDEDWSSVNLNVSRLVVKALYDTNVGDLGLRLFNANGDRIGEQLVEDSTGVTLEYNVEIQGLYYISVAGTGAVPYTLQITTNTVWQVTFDNFGPIYSSNVTLADIDGDGTKEILVGCAKYLDDQHNEVRQGGLLCLNADGTLRWSKVFPATAGAQAVTGKTYTSTGVNSAPLVEDVTGDGVPEIFVGLGGIAVPSDKRIAGVDGQPGDMGGVACLDINGNTIWTINTRDTIGGIDNVGDGDKDGVRSDVVVGDINKDGTKEVVFTSWDRHVYVANATNGNLLTGWPIDVLDTVWATPIISDFNGDGTVNILVSADITTNPDAGTTTGGIFHVFDINGFQNTPGFDQFVTTNPSSYPVLKGIYEPQTLWSHPLLGDLDKDGNMDIIYGTGTFNSNAGRYYRVRNNDGTIKHTLPTQGDVIAAPLMADLTGDGTNEIVGADYTGAIYVWDNAGNQVWRTQTFPYGVNGTSFSIQSSPLAIDLDGDGSMEIIVQQHSGLVILNASGQQLNSTTKSDYYNFFSTGTPAIADIDNDNTLDIISGATNLALDRAVVYRWRYGTGNATNPRTGKTSNRNIYDMVSSVLRVIGITLPDGNAAAHQGGTNGTVSGTTTTFGGLDPQTDDVFTLSPAGNG